MIRGTVAAIALAIAYYIVFITRIGPVVLVLTRTHGVHSGDSLSFPFVAIALAMAYPWRHAATTTAR
ncbi:MAG TPA: hypothetical protein VK461_06160 [Acidimicrobiales bacterium]|nr:hypothetical protein [Acidimicrobiales bacterium]